MTLHQTIELAKRVSFWIGISFGGLIGVVLLFQLGVIIKNLLFPPKIQPPNFKYDKLQAIQFPKNATTQPLTYTINTVTGELPELSDRLNVYPIVQAQPNFLNLNKAKEKVGILGFTSDEGTVLPEKALGNGLYQWTEDTSMKRQMTFNIVTFDFLFESNYLSSLTVLEAKSLSTEARAMNLTKTWLESIALLPEDIDMDKTTNPLKTVSYTTYPQLFAIRNGTLTRTSSLANAQIIRVNLYQKDLAYELNTGLPDLTGKITKTPITVPLLYPNPPYSTMSFWIGSGQLGPQIVTADFTHQTIDFTPDADATYLLKTPQVAFEELKNGKAYIAAYDETKPTTIKITNIYLAYYLGEIPQKYLMPIIVFEGENGFFAYVSAITDDWIQ